eukprot:RCo012601
MLGHPLPTTVLLLVAMVVLWLHMPLEHPPSIRSTHTHPVTTPATADSSLTARGTLQSVALHGSTDPFSLGAVERASAVGKPPVPDFIRPQSPQGSSPQQPLVAGLQGPLRLPRSLPTPMPFQVTPRDTSDMCDGGLIRELCELSCNPAVMAALVHLVDAQVPSGGAPGCQWKLSSGWPNPYAPRGGEGVGGKGLVALQS